MSWLIVTPARNEADRLPALAASLARQEPGLVGLWVVVDDGSTDGTAESIPSGLPFPVRVVARANSGGLRGGSAFAAFFFGVSAGLNDLPDAERVMKLDADVVLADDHLARLSAVPLSVGLVAGRMDQAGGERGRADYTRGPFKAYNRAALAALERLPIALGYDVMDEVCLRAAGLEVQVVPEASATVTRRTGSSEGWLQGRRRAGVVSRWTGYDPFYFLLRLVRYSVRPPYVVGSLVIFCSWLTAGSGPYPSTLKRAHRTEQRRRLRSAAGSPHQLARNRS
jgi:glycosyltransferase involved in cell wall biosynthesis